MTDWLHASPLLILVFLAALIAVPAIIKRRIARNRIVRPYVGETIRHREKDEQRGF